MNEPDLLSNVSYDLEAKTASKLMIEQRMARLSRLEESVRWCYFNSHCSRSDLRCDCFWHTWEFLSSLDHLYQCWISHTCILISSLFSNFVYMLKDDHRILVSQFSHAERLVEFNPVQVDHDHRIMQAQNSQKKVWIKKKLELESAVKNSEWKEEEQDED